MLNSLINKYTIIIKKIKFNAKKNLLKISKLKLNGENKIICIFCAPNIVYVIQQQTNIILTIFCIFSDFTKLGVHFSRIRYVFFDSFVLI